MAEETKEEKFTEEDLKRFDKVIEAEELSCDAIRKTFGHTSLVAAIGGMVLEKDLERRFRLKAALHNKARLLHELSSDVEKAARSLALPKEEPCPEKASPKHN